MGISGNMPGTQYAALLQAVGGKVGVEALDKRLGIMPGYRDITGFDGEVITYLTHEGITRRTSITEDARRLRQKTSAGSY